jgi:chemotaxis protein methyltransferase CheR
MIADEASIAFLKWCLPELGLRWAGFRKVRRLVAKRLKRRLAQLGLPDLDAYRALLLREPGEWARLDALCRIPISRFYRDRRVFDVIGREVLPALGAAAAAARGDTGLRCWSAGCASGEEPYTLALLWRFVAAAANPALGFAVVASDSDETMLQRAATACYAPSSLRELPPAWLDRAFARSGDLLCLLPECRRDVRFLLQDIRRAMPEGPFDLILCRNLVFTYFDDALQRRLLREIGERLAPGGVFVIGAHETLPEGSAGIVPFSRGLPIYRRADGAAAPLSPATRPEARVPPPAHPA